MDVKFTLPSSVSTMQSADELSMYMLRDKVGSNMAWLSHSALARCSTMCSVHLVSLSVLGSDFVYYI